jgi:nicotinamidase-related amidase
MSTALIILDMAKGYGWKPGSHGYDMVARVRSLKDAALAANVQVFHVHSMRRATDGLDNPMMLFGTEALELIPELEPSNKDIFINKRYLSGFSYNDLDYTMRTMGVNTVLIAGASTDNTVLWTAADAFQLRYNVVVIEDCTMVHRETERPQAHEYALRIVQNVLHSKVISMDEAIITYLS